MNATIKLLKGDPFDVAVEPSGTVRELKAALEASHGLPANRLCLILNGTELDDDELIASTGMCDGCRLDAVLRKPTSVSLLVKAVGAKGGSWPLNALLTWTAAELKQAVFELTGIPRSDQRLVHKGAVVSDQGCRAVLGFSDGDILHVTRRLPTTSLQIFVKMITGKVMSIYVPADATTEQLKQLVEEREGYPAEDQRMIFAGKGLENGRSLSDYNIMNESTVHMVLRLRH